MAFDGHNIHHISSYIEWQEKHSTLYYHNYDATSQRERRRQKTQTWFEYIHVSDIDTYWWSGGGNQKVFYLINVWIFSYHWIQHILYLTGKVRITPSEGNLFTLYKDPPRINTIDAYTYITWNKNSLRPLFVFTKQSSFSDECDLSLPFIRLTLFDGKSHVFRWMEGKECHWLGDAPHAQTGMGTLHVAPDQW